MEYVLETDRISKRYGSVQALKEVTLQIPRGSVYGILGPNGSGKTTLLGIIMNILIQDSGNIKIFGEDPMPAHRKRIGTLLETPNFYHYLNAIQNLKISAAIKSLASPDYESILKQVNLFHRKDSPFQTYSLGMKQRLAIAGCLLGNPEVMVFDEPTNGLDPAGIAEVRDIIKKLAQEGKTIIMASHLLDEVEKVCTHVAILKKGDLLMHGPVQEILANDDIVEVSAAETEALMKVLTALPGQKGIFLNPEEKVTIHFPPGKANLAEVNLHCFRNGITLQWLTVKRKSLESKFIEITE